MMKILNLRKTLDFNRKRNFKYTIPLDFRQGTHCWGRFEDCTWIERFRKSRYVLRGLKKSKKSKNISDLTPYTNLHGHFLRYFFNFLTIKKWKNAFFGATGFKKCVKWDFLIGKIASLNYFLQITNKMALNTSRDIFVMILHSPLWKIVLCSDPSDILSKFLPNNN